MKGDSVKGAVLIDFVRIVRANPEMPWEKYMTSGDMELVRSKVMPSAWYPFEALCRIGYAVFMLTGKGNLDAAKGFGSFSMQDTFQKVYKDVLFGEKDPLSALSKFVTLRNQFVKFRDSGFESLKMEKIAENRVRMTVKAPEYDRYIEPYAYHFAGATEKLLELSGAKDVGSRIIKIQSRTEPATEIEFSWSST